MTKVPLARHLISLFLFSPLTDLRRIRFPILRTDRENFLCAIYFCPAKKASPFYAKTCYIRITYLLSSPIISFLFVLVAEAGVQPLPWNVSHAIPLIVTFCFSRTAISKNDIRFTLYPLGFIVSAIFLAATLAAGWLLPASHHVLHWRCQTHHVACLMVGDLFMAIIQLAGDSLEGELCKALGEFMNILFLFLTRILSLPFY